MMKKDGEGAKQGELAKFKFKAKENGLANFVIEGEFYSSVGQLIETNFEQEQVQIGKDESLLQKQAKEEQGNNQKSNNAFLQSLRLDQEGMIPNFEKNIYDYTISVSDKVNDLDVLYITENPKATVEIEGNTNLKQGLNTIKLYVTSEDKTHKNTYTIEVTKTSDLNTANTNLETLAIENTLLNPHFDNTTTRYEAEVSNEITSLNILAIPEDEKATVKIQGKDNLKEGNNYITITVTAQNNITKRDYEINVHKRSINEEEKYEQDKSENQNKLEEAYNIEKTSSEVKKEER